MVRIIDGFLRWVFGYLLCKVAPVLPLSWLYALGDLSGRLRVRFSPAVVERIARNISAGSNREFSPEHSRRIAATMFQMQAKQTLETYLFGNYSEQKLMRTVTVSGEKHLLDALAKGRGAILISPHMAGYLILSVYLKRHGLKENQIYRSSKGQDTTYLNRLADRNRAAALARLLDGKLRYQNGGSVREVLRDLAENNVLRLFPDARLDHDELGNTAEVHFLRRALLVQTGFARLSLQSGAPLIPVLPLRTDDNCNHYEILPPITPPESGNKKEDIQYLVSAGMKIMEEHILKHPEQWLLWARYDDYPTPGEATSETGSENKALVK